MLNSDAAKRGFAQSKRFADGIRYVKGRKTDFSEKNPRLSALIRVRFFELRIAEVCEAPNCVTINDRGMNSVMRDK